MSIQRLRGMHDIFGAEACLFEHIEKTARSVFSRFGFGELRTPVLEEKELFLRALGSETDVVQKEMYEFKDRSEVSVAMRPEGTAGVVRAYLENELDKKEGLVKFYYLGPMFRSERPQAGRLRQFHQVGVEILGTDSPAADAESIHALCVFLDEAGAGGYQVKLNNLGTFEERKEYRGKLAEYFSPLLAELCEDCKARFSRNVFRLLDCKNETCRRLAKSAPLIQHFLTSESRAHFDKVCALLQRAGVSYEADPLLVRGLDYYTRTVFELSHPGLGAQDAIAAGGRYDKLIEAFGGTASGAVGFAAGMERLAMVIGQKREAPKKINSVFIVALGEEAAAAAFEVMSELRAYGVRAEMDLSPKSMKSQMRLADKSGSPFVLIVGDNEMKSGQWVLKNMKDGAQTEVGRKELVSVLKGKLL